jgi:hypothetical protein
MIALEMGQFVYKARRYPKRIAFRIDTSLLDKRINKSMTVQPNPTRASTVGCNGSPYTLRPRDDGRGA